MSIPPLSPGLGLRISPTDVSQFIRLEQCERYLRLRLQEGAQGQGFLRESGAAPQPIPPLLTRSGREFEARIQAAVAARLPSLDCAAETARPGDDDHGLLAQAAAGLAAGARVVLFQPRLRVELEGWRLRGIPDLLCLERGAEGGLRLLIVDIKSSTRVRVEHRLQVAFYHAMLARLLADAGAPAVEFATAILYEGPAAAGEGSPPGEEAERLERDRAAALASFGLEEGFLERIEDPAAYLDSVRDLVTGPDSAARRAAAADFDALDFHLTYKCDGCLYHEFCMRRSAQQDDLSLLPHLTAAEKAALHRVGIRTTSDMALLKEPAPEDRELLRPAPGREALCRAAAAAWPVGPRVDELVHRARRYRRWRRDDIEALSYLPGKGYGTLPYTDPDHNPNLVRVYIDAQHDYLNDRLYMLGALVTACENGEVARRRSVVRLADGPPDGAGKESRLLGEWVAETLRAVVELAAPDESGASRAPIHLVFYNEFEQRLLLQALARHFSDVLGAAPALYEFITQLAAFDSPVATFLDQEIRELKNYPMVCQSLQAVAARLRFDWDAGEPFTRHFRMRIFDEWRKLEEDGAEPRWYTGRARFSSQIPLEYAYAAWDDLLPPTPGERDVYAPYRGVTPELLRRFQARRLDALEWIAGDFPGNRQTLKAPFDLPELARFSQRAGSLAQALDEFLTIERHVELGEWKAIRHAPPERRVLMGEALLARYRPEDQDPAAAEQNRENERRRRLQEVYRAEAREAEPEAERIRLTEEQRAASDWSQEGMRLRLRLEEAGLDCGLEEALALCTLRPGERLVVNPRWTVDERLPEADRTPFTPTPRQMLYGTRATLVGIETEEDAEGRVTGGWVEIELAGRAGSTHPRGFIFGAFPRPLRDGELYSLDPCPNNIYGSWCARVTEGLRAIAAGGPGRSALYERISGDGAPAPLPLPPAARAGQERFLAGLDALREAGALHAFEPAKREYIGGHADAPLLLVQGPPGTGKSYSTGFALFARMQGAMAADRDFRAIVSCKTHAATDVLLESVAAVQALLRERAASHPALFDRYFDRRLLEVPLWRVNPREGVEPGIRAIAAPRARAALSGERWGVAGATPGSVYKMVPSGGLFARFFCDCLVLDEASQMNLPEALMAALPLRPEGPVIVVGDHRQMPPIVHHDWASEPRRTFAEYRAYESLFLALLPLGPPVIRFAESFRLHADAAEFLRREIYRLDGIEFFSRSRAALPSREIADPFVRAVLHPEHAMVVVVHDEARSQTRNPFEQALLAPVLETLADPAGFGLDPAEGIGVVVPHRAQRAALQLAVPALAIPAPGPGSVSRSAVDTVERFQGGERMVILVSATESDRNYLLASSGFLLDPRRLTVAASRARKKLVLVASRSVFSLFSPEEETFAHSQLWKNLLRRTCTRLLWSGPRNGQSVEVWGCVPATDGRGSDA